MNGPLKFLTLRKILPLLDLLVTRYYLLSCQAAADLNARYFTELDRTNYSLNEYSVFGYDAVWAAALTMNRSIDIMKAKGKRLEDFDYKDNEMAQIFKQVMSNLSFIGMSVRRSLQ